MRTTNRLLGVAVTATLLACGGAMTQEAEPASETVLPLVVTSGLPQPEPVRTTARAGAGVVARVEGLGPARAAVFAPDGARVSTTDAPLRRDGHVVGTEQRFVVPRPGTYRLENAEAPGSVLGVVDVR